MMCRKESEEKREARAGKQGEKQENFFKLCFSVFFCVLLGFNCVFELCFSVFPNCVRACFSVFLGYFRIREKEVTALRK
jgi:hypothetical protein